MTVWIHFCYIVDGADVQFKCPKQRRSVTSYIYLIPELFPSKTKSVSETGSEFNI